MADQPKLKSVLSFRAEMVGGFDEEFIRGKEFLFQQTEFDDSGKPLNETTFTSSGILEHRYIYTYDDKGRVIEEILMEQDEEVAEHRTMDYNDKDQLVNEYLHYLDGSADTRKHVYNSDGLLVLITDENSDGETEGRVEYVYENGRLVAEKTYGFSGELASQKILKRDGDGRILEEIAENGEESYRVVSEYDEKGIRVLSKRYDNRNRLIERIAYTTDEKGLVTAYDEETMSGLSHSLLKYDETGDLTIQEEFDKDGSLLHKVERTKDEQGRLNTTYIYTNGQNRRPTQDYRIRFEYEYY
jgi:antitoxin component YwqK of YwqJK toxin-antitoxin module